mgnify:CR=1 FL=1
MRLGGLLSGPVIGGLAGRTIAKLYGDRITKKVLKRTPSVLRKYVRVRLRRVMKNIQPWATGLGALAGLGTVLSIYGILHILNAKRQSRKK